MLRFLLLLIVCLGGLQAQTRTVVGAIRWDAWHGQKGVPGQAMERSLGPTEWHYRLPFFARVISPAEVRIEGDSQQVMDREIAYARRAGLDYWAFLAYDPADPMSLGLKYYLSSHHRNDIRFCLITEQSRWGTHSDHNAAIERIVQLMGEKNYQTVLDGRPLFYLGFIDDETTRRNWGTEAEFRNAIDELRAAVVKSGRRNPYLVLMDFDAARGGRRASALGFDAISSYATSDGGKAAPYQKLATAAERFWERCKATGVQVVPIIMSGWDRRPRVVHPVPWEAHYQKPGVGLDLYYAAPTPKELAAHVKRALQWIDDNPAATQARAALIYAWNENDEGGWLVPTLSE